MTPTEVLMNEHRLIEKVLSALEAQVRSILAGGAFDAHRSRETVRFIREFADRYHHAKEEDQLFPMMERRGFSRQAGPIAVMLAEHDEGRGHVKIMADAAGSPQQEGAGERYARAAGSFVEMLRSHIMKEDQILYPMADQHLAPSDQEELAKVFAKIDTEVFDPERIAELRALAESLCEV